MGDQSSSHSMVLVSSDSSHISYEVLNTATHAVTIFSALGFATAASLAYSAIAKTEKRRKNIRN